MEVANEDMVTDIYQGAYYSITKYMGGESLTHTFMLNREAELEDLDGTTFKTTVRLEGGKIKIQFPKYVYTAEVSGDKLIEVSVHACYTREFCYEDRTLLAVLYSRLIPFRMGLPTRW